MSIYDDLKAALAVYTEASEHHARLPLVHQATQSKIVNAAYQHYQDVRVRVNAEWLRL